MSTHEVDEEASTKLCIMADRDLGGVMFKGSVRAQVVSCASDCRLVVRSVGQSQGSNQSG